jgi:hypothetical protein
MARPGDKGQRTTHATFAEALVESGLEREADKVDRFLSDVEQVAAKEGRAPDAWTVPLAKRQVRAAWDDYGKVVLHAGFIHCRYQLAGYGPLEEGQWYRFSFPDHRPGTRNPKHTPVESWLCACGNRLNVTAECERCGPWPGAPIPND